MDGAKRLNIEVPEEVRILIKTSAAMHGMSIKKWVLRAIMDKVKKEKQYE
jgi:uncharacterized protein (DUF1778 family)